MTLSALLHAGTSRRAAIVVAALAVVLASRVPSVSADSALVWSPPTLVDAYALDYAVDALSCPSTSLCVVVDQEGNILASSDPTVATPTWTHSVTSRAGEPLPVLSVDCLSNTLCYAGEFGGVLVSRNAGAATPIWTPLEISGSNYLQQVSCPTSSLCVAVEQDDGLALASTEPTSAAAWMSAGIDASDDLTGLSCASEKLCIAFDNAGNLLTSTDPAALDPTWKSIKPLEGGVVTGMSCISEFLCIGAADKEGSGYILRSGNPGAGGPAWIPADVDPQQGDDNGLTAISCVPTYFCAAVDKEGNVLTSSDPGSAEPTWNTANVDGTNYMDDVSCASESFCVALDDHGQIVVGKVTHALAVSLLGTGTGSVEGQGISCHSSCSAAYIAGESVTLTAVPDAGSEFTGWGGACSGTGSCAVNLNSEQSVTANFASVPPVLTEPKMTGTSLPTEVGPEKAVDASPLAVVSAFSPLFATRADLSGRSLGLLVGIPLIKDIATGAMAGVRCYAACSYDLKIVRRIRRHASDTIKLERPLVLRRETRIEITVSQPDRVGRFADYGFKRTPHGLVGYLIGHGCIDAAGAHQACS